MSLNLPALIELCISAANRTATESVKDCFTEDAVVRDEGRAMQGIEAIQDWMAETRRKYRHTMEPLFVAQEGQVMIVTNHLTGSFPGSPIEVRFRFLLGADKIAGLEIG